MYSVDDYIRMSLDQARSRGYRDALATIPVEGRTVLDLGAGPGILSVVAARLRARHVFAVDRADIVDMGRTVARENGCEDRITFIKGDSRRLSLPQSVDVIVSDLRGALPVFGTHVATIIDARRRHLSRGGILVPASDQVLAALVQASDWYESHVGALARLPLDIDASELARRNVNQVHRVQLSREALVTDAAPCATWSYDTIEQANVTVDLEWTIPAPATAHGAALWFVTNLHGGIGFDSSPGSPVSLYGQLLLPFEKPLSLAVGDTVRMSIDARLVVDDYVYTWRTEARGHSTTARFHQSTFFADVFSPSQLAGVGDDAQPALSTRGDITLTILTMMREGDATIREIATRLRARFGDVFDSPEQAMDHVRKTVRNHAD